MSAKRAIVSIVVITAMTVLCVSALAAQGSATSGPALGKWAFTGKDNTGLVWTGALSIEKLDPSRFDPKRNHALCSLEVESTDPSKGSRGVEAPCAWDPGTRTISFTTGFTVIHLYAAILSADGKTLTQGKWTENRRGDNDQPGPLVRSGTWTAKLPAK